MIEFHMENTLLAIVAFAILYWLLSKLCFRYFVRRYGETS